MNRGYSQLHTAVRLLKRRYGIPAMLVKQRTGSVRNLETGAVTIEHDFYKIKSLILLPARDRTIILVNQNTGNFDFGNFVNTSDITFIVDAKDIDVEIENKDWIIQNSKKYQVKEIYPIIEDVSFLVICEHLSNDTLDLLGANCLTGVFLDNQVVGTV